MAGSAEPPTDTGAALFLSRARHHAVVAGNPARVRTDPEWERFVETRFAEAGFDVVHPEELPVSRQISLVRGADLIAGLSGSALHLGVFAPEGTRVVELGDERSPSQPRPAQVMLDAKLGHRAAFVPYQDADALEVLLRETAVGH